MASHHINFTKAALMAIQPPQKTDGQSGGIFDTYHDLKEKGLVLLVSHGGAKTFYLYKKINGKPKRIKLGSFPELTIERAREKCTHNKSVIIEGQDPAEVAKSKKLESSLASLFEEYLERHAKPHKRSWQHDEELFNAVFMPLKNRKLSEIKQQDVQRWHQDIRTERGLYRANRALALLSVLYNKAIEWGWQGGNPAKHIRKFKETSRERFLQPEELPKFFEALDAEPNVDMRDYFIALLLTGARRRNVAAMRWEDISLELKIWRIPETKSGDAQTVNLPDAMVELLKQRSHTQQSGFVFPSPKSKLGYLQEPKSAWGRILKRAGISDLRIHDLRRTLGSYQAIHGASLSIIGQSLGHKSSASTQVYARLNADPVRESIEKATQSIFALRKKAD